MDDRQLQYYSAVAEFLGVVLGPNYEIVVSDLHAARCVVNGRISRRSVGAPLPDFAQNLIRSRIYEQVDWKANYRGVTQDGKVLRCSTFFIRNGGPTGGRELMGLLCINFDDTRYKELADTIFSLAHPLDYIRKNITIQMTQLPAEETLYSNMDEAVRQAYEAVVPDGDANPADLGYEEKLEIVQKLKESGIFKLKGSIPYVAKKLGISVSSMYRYLSVLKES